MREGLENEDRHTREKPKDVQDESNKQTENADRMKTIQATNLKNLSLTNSINLSFISCARGEFLLRLDLDLEHGGMHVGQRNTMITMKEPQLPVSL